MRIADLTGSELVENAWLLRVRYFLNADLADQADENRISLTTEYTEGAEKDRIRIPGKTR